MPSSIPSEYVCKDDLERKVNDFEGKDITCEELGDSKYDDDREDICDKRGIGNKICPVTCNACKKCPIISPTDIPSIIPSNHPSIFPSAIHTCKDKMSNMPNFRYQEKTFENKTCDWLIKQKRKGLLCNRVEIVKTNCPETCNSCPTF